MWLFVCTCVCRCVFVPLVNQIHIHDFSWGHQRKSGKKSRDRNIHLLHAWWILSLKLPISHLLPEFHSVHHIWRLKICNTRDSCALDWAHSHTHIHTNTFMCTWCVQGKKMKIYVSWKSSCTLFCIYCFFFPKLFLLDMSCMLISSKDKIKRHFQEYLNTYWRLNGSSRQINELYKPIFKFKTRIIHFYSWQTWAEKVHHITTLPWNFSLPYICIIKIKIYLYMSICVLHVA